MEWLLAAVMGYALTLLLIGLYIVIRGLPAGSFGSGSAKEAHGGRQCDGSQALLLLP
jgi:hypothetical protein